MKRTALLVLLAALVLLLPRPASSRVPFRWSPAPWPAAVIPSVFLGVGESDQRPTGAPEYKAEPTIRVVAPVSVVGSDAPYPAGSRLPSTGAPTHPAVVSESPRPPVPLVGWATWYATSGPGEYAAAGPALRFDGWRGSHVVVCAFPGGQATCITIPLTDWCACGDRNGAPTLLDLSADAFRQLGALSQGVLRVTVQVLGGKP